MAEEKAVPYKSVGPGTNILQGRGGQAIIQDIVGNIFLTTQNNTGSNQRVLSVNDSISSIALLSGEAPVSIGTEIDFPSRNFNTINYEQTPIGGVQVIQPTRNVTTQSLNIVVDLPPTSSVPTSSVIQQVEQKITPIEEQILFLPDSETEVFAVITDKNIVGVVETEADPLRLDLATFITSNVSSGRVGDIIKSSSSCGIINKNKKSFVEVFRLVVNNLEGLYFHPSMINDGRIDPKYKTIYQRSGETLFGLDRRQGSRDVAAQRFWAKLDSYNPNSNPRWRYNTLGNLNQTQKDELYNLGYKVIQPSYNEALSKIPTELRTIIESDGRLLFSFIYGVWNGPGWYSGYLRLLTKAYNSGVKSPDELLKKHIDDRKNPKRIYPNSDQNSLNIQIKSGFDLERLTGLNCSR